MTVLARIGLVWAIGTLSFKKHIIRNQCSQLVHQVILEIRRLAPNFHRHGKGVGGEDGGRGGIGSVLTGGRTFDVLKPKRNFFWREDGLPRGFIGQHGLMFAMSAAKLCFDRTLTLLAPS